MRETEHFCFYTSNISIAMDTSFVDLDILLTRVRNTRSEIYFLDAVRAYRAGALRASLTAAWVALVYDLIDKYRELSALNDPAAEKFIQSWDNAIDSGNTKRLLELERNILENALKETQVINPIAYTHLERLREDRHLCAHPTFSAKTDLFEPIPELVRLHLVNIVDLVLSQEPLQGKAILESFDDDVRSPGFPRTRAKIIDYVELHYLKRVRTHNIQNFGIVLTKSLIKGEPPKWEPQHDKIVSSLVAVSERSSQVWPDISKTIVNLIDGLEPENRPRAATFIAIFPDFWPLLRQTTRTTLLGTIENADFNTLEKYRMLECATFSQFREPLLSVITNFDQNQLENAIKVKPLTCLWDSAIKFYKGSLSYRGSEANFRKLIAPFAGRLNNQQHDQLFDAVICNWENWNAADTEKLLFNMLHDANISALPTHDARDRFYWHIRKKRALEYYKKIFELLQKDGWTPSSPSQQNDDE